MSQATPTPSTGAVSTGVIAVLVLGAGFVLIPTLASASPELINGFLILVLVGIILGNSGKWVPWLTNLSSIPGTIGGQTHPGGGAVKTQ